MSSNPYSPPKAAVSDISNVEEYQEVRMFSAAGRVGRLRYLAYTTGGALLAGVVAAIIMAVLGESVGAVVSILLYVVLIVFGILVAIQRSHDMNWSGWTVLLTIIPFVGLIWIFKPGTEGANDYGAPPPPNTIGVKILGLLLPIIFLAGVMAAIFIPAYVAYTQRAAGG